MVAQDGRATVSDVKDAGDKKAWILVTPLEDDVINEVADELRVLNSEGGDDILP